MSWQIDLYYLFFLGFAIHMAWILGKQTGISNTLDYLQENKKIDLDD